MTVVSVEDVGTCWLADRSLTREAGMDSQLIVWEGNTLGEWEPPGAVEVMVMQGQHHRAHMEPEPGTMMIREDMRHLGVTDEDRAPLPPEPSIKQKRGHNSINVIFSDVG